MSPAASLSQTILRRRCGALNVLREWETPIRDENGKAPVEILGNDINHESDIVFMDLAIIVQDLSLRGSSSPAKRRNSRLLLFFGQLPT